MAQYQTFPGAPGDSMTLDKLKRLAFPDMAGKTFLDVGCNEGFFCGFAKFLGARRSVGIDHSQGFIARARQRFPGCEFHARSWDDLPKGPFDVILLASALHYAKDQEALLHELVAHLSPDGVLIVELGIVTSKASEWVNVQRGQDERLFATMPKLREVLAPYAWKWMGPSINQAGDPVNRHVLHVSPRKRTAYLLMQPPAYGKSTIARTLFGGTRVPVVSGDQVIGQVAAGKLAAPKGLARAIGEDYSPYRIDQAIARVFERGHGGALVDLWLAQAGDGDFALDMYVPREHQATVRGHLDAAGYLTVLLDWERPGATLLSAATLQERGEAFYFSMVEGAVPSATANAAGPAGFVDEVTLARGRLEFRGWAIDGNGRLPARLSVRLGREVHEIDDFDRQLRPDVQQHLGLPHALVGYRASIPCTRMKRVRQLGGRFEVRAGPDGDAFRFAEALEKAFERPGEAE